MDVKDTLVGRFFRAGAQSGPPVTFIAGGMNVPVILAGALTGDWKMATISAAVIPVAVGIDWLCMNQTQKDFVLER